MNYIECPICPKTADVYVWTEIDNQVICIRCHQKCPEPRATWPLTYRHAGVKGEVICFPMHFEPEPEPNVPMSILDHML